MRKGNEMSDPDALIASAKRTLWISRGPNNLLISVDDAQLVISDRPDGKEWSRIVNLALGSKARTISIIDDGRESP